MKLKFQIWTNGRAMLHRLRDRMQYMQLCMHVIDHESVIYVNAKLRHTKK